MATLSAMALPTQSELHQIMIKDTKARLEKHMDKYAASFEACCAFASAGYFSDQFIAAWETINQEAREVEGKFIEMFKAWADTDDADREATKVALARLGTASRAADEAFAKMDIVQIHVQKVVRRRTLGTALD